LPKTGRIFGIPLAYSTEAGRWPQRQGPTSEIVLWRVWKTGHPLFAKARAQIDNAHGAFAISKKKKTYRALSRCRTKRRWWLAKITARPFAEEGSRQQGRATFCYWCVGFGSCCLNLACGETVAEIWAEWGARARGHAKGGMCLGWAYSHRSLGATSLGTLFRPSAALMKVKRFATRVLGGCSGFVIALWGSWLRWFKLQGTKRIAAAGREINIDFGEVLVFTTVG